MTAQADALMEVAAGTSDAAVIDLLMATAMSEKEQIMRILLIR